MLFDRTSMSGSTEPVTPTRWKKAPSSMDSIPFISRKWFHTGGMSLTGKSRWKSWTNIHTSKLKLKVWQILGRISISPIHFLNYIFLFYFNVGLDVHFMHVRPPKRQNQRVLPIMLVHGWPGSFYEFYKIMPLLTENRGGIAFEVICPSIPGYGFSEAPHKQGRFTHTEFSFQL